jgi:hypothetical protein
LIGRFNWISRGIDGGDGAHILILIIIIDVCCLRKTFSAVLTGDNEVSPVNTDTSGKIKLFANPQQNMLDSGLSISDLNGVVRELIFTQAV